MNVSDLELLMKIQNQDNTEVWLDEISSEIRAAFSALSQVKNGVSVFGSARVKPETEQYRLGVETGSWLVKNGFQVITGGGPGLMRAANEGAFQAGGLSVGLGIDLPHEQGQNEFVNLAVDFKHFFTRKMMFVRYACAFVALPGGFGTLDELFEALTLIQTKKIYEFPVILLGTEFWGGLVDWIRDSQLAQGYISEKDLPLLTVTDDLNEMTEIIVAANKKQREYIANLASGSAY